MLKLDAANCMAALVQRPVKRNGIITSAIAKCNGARMGVNYKIN